MILSGCHLYPPWKKYLWLLQKGFREILFACLYKLLRYNNGQEVSLLAFICVNIKRRPNSTFLRKLFVGEITLRHTWISEKFRFDHTYVFMARLFQRRFVAFFSFYILFCANRFVLRPISDTNTPSPKFSRLAKIIQN